MMKRKIFFAVICGMSVFCQGCSNPNVNPGANQKSTLNTMSEQKFSSLSYLFDNVEYTIDEVPRLETTLHSETEWVSVEQISVHECCDLVVKGKVSNIHEVAISYNFMNSDVTDYGTVFDLTISKIYQGSQDIGDTITVYLPWSSRNLPEEVPDVTDGSTYYFLLMDSKKDTQGTSNFSDYYVRYAKAFMLQEDAPQKKISDLLEVLNTALNKKDGASQIDLTGASETQNVDTILTNYFH